MIRYHPEVFNRATIEEAQRIILTTEAGLTPEQRWELETDWLMKRVNFPAGLTVIDYGCGIGRMARRIEAGVIGVDISFTMRGMAIMQLADRPLFTVMQPPMLRHLVDNGLQADGALAIWVLQHAASPEDDIALLHDALAPGAALWVVNATSRMIPTVDADAVFAWCQDDKDVFALLDDYFQMELSEPMPLALCSPGSELRMYIRR